MTTYIGVANTDQTSLQSYQSGGAATQAKALGMTYAYTNGSDLTNSGTSPATIPAATLLQGVVVCSGGSANTNTTDTYANIMAKIVNPFPGLTFDILFVNANSGTMTIAGGTGITVFGTATIAANACRTFMFVNDPVTPGQAYLFSKS